MRKNSSAKKKAISVLIGTLVITTVLPMGVRADDAEDYGSDIEVEENTENYISEIDMEENEEDYVSDIVVEENTIDIDVPVIKEKKVELEDKAGEYGTGAVVIIEAEDVGPSGLAEKAYSFNENDWQESNTYHVESDGIVFFSIRDAAGNIVDGQAEVRGIDREAPVITITEKENDTKNGIMKLEIKAEDKGAGITELSWQNDDAGAPLILQETSDGQKSVCKEITIDRNGEYTFLAEDALHNRASKAMKVVKIKKEDQKEQEKEQEKEDQKSQEKEQEKEQVKEDQKGREKEKEKGDQKGQEKEKEKGDQKGQEKEKEKEYENEQEMERENNKVRGKKREKDRERIRENYRGGKENGHDRMIVVPVTAKSEKDTEQDHKQGKTGKIVTTSPEKKEEKKNRKKIIVGDTGSSSYTEEENSFGKRRLTESSNKIPYSFLDGENEEDETRLSENVINTTVYYTDSSDDESFSKDGYFEDTEDELDNIDFDQVDVKTEKKSVAGIVVGGVMILLLSAVSVYILWKKEIIKMPVDREMEE